MVVPWDKPSTAFFTYVSKDGSVEDTFLSFWIVIFEFQSPFYIRQCNIQYPFLYHLRGCDCYRFFCMERFFCHSNISFSLNRRWPLKSRADSLEGRVNQTKVLCWVIVMRDYNWQCTCRKLAGWQVQPETKRSDVWHPVSMSSGNRTHPLGWFWVTLGKEHQLNA